MRPCCRADLRHGRASGVDCTIVCNDATGIGAHPLYPHRQHRARGAAARAEQPHLHLPATPAVPYPPQTGKAAAAGGGTAFPDRDHSRAHAFIRASAARPVHSGRWLWRMGSCIGGRRLRARHERRRNHHRQKPGHHLPGGSAAGAGKPPPGEVVTAEDLVPQ